MAKYVPPHRRGDGKATGTPPPVVAPAAEPQLIGSNFPYELNFFHENLYRRSPLLRSLHLLKDEFEKDENVERMFQKNRATSVHTMSPAASKDSALSSRFADQFKGAMNEIDRQAAGRLKNRITRFLDLGAAPGGFSKWILEENEGATGMAVTLSPEMDGLPMVLEGALSDPTRYRSTYRDVTDRPMDISFIRPSESDPPTEADYVPQPACDLVIAGSIYRDHSTADPSRTSPPPIRGRSRQQLAISQILTALANLMEGGTMIVVSNMKPLLYNLEILCFLHPLFEQLIPVKPTGVHTIRSSYYLVALGFKREDAVATGAYTKLQEALEKIAASDEILGFEGCLLLKEDESVIIDKWADYILEFFQPFWQSQTEALQAKLTRLRREGQTSSRPQQAWKNQNRKDQHTGGWRRAA
ncbi:hypothetical protein DFS34DRAFT_649524 [Phlyctochytrium arcticum]|nr:hypothetical protein DFS34DRAFT_649524 [Phlyctochytrium arcticum]